MSSTKLSIGAAFKDSVLCVTVLEPVFKYAGPVLGLGSKKVILPQACQIMFSNVYNTITLN